MKKTLRNLGLATAFSLVGTSAFAGILKSPYLIYPANNNQMQVIWQDDTAGETNVISWGSDTTYSMGSATAPEFGDKQHQYTITGLTPNTMYYYQVKDQTSGTVYQSGSFITAPDNNVSAIRFLAMGDTRSQPFALDNVMEAMAGFYKIPGNADYQRLVIHNGDWVSTDGESYWTSQWFDRTKANIINFTANTPIDGVKGNHDNASGYSATFPKYFPFPYPNETAKTVSPTTDASGNQYYNNLYWSFDYGPVHFTMIDEYSSYAPGSAQYTWLVNDLASTGKPWKIVVYHEPSYSAGKDTDNVAVRALEPLFTQYGVDVIYAGHSHNYARTGAYTLSQANGDQVALNIPHITSGGGAAPVYQPDMSNAGSFPHVITAWPAFEFMAFDINGKTLSMTAYQVSNASTAATVPLSANFPATDGTGLFLEKIETTVVNHFNNVTPQVSVSTTGFLYSRATGLYTANMTVKNNGPALSGNVHVVLDGILDLKALGTPSNQYSTTSPKQTSMIANKPATGTGSTDPGLISTVTLTNATGTNNGEPMIKVSSNGLASGASVTVPITFKNPNNINITFSPVVFEE